LNIFVTPSHHRVHHSTNDKYLDKNFGSTFIIWDRIFGTFQAEEEQTVYIINQFIKPITLNFHEWKDIVFRKNVIKRSYMMLFTSPSKLETVKAIQFKENSKHVKGQINL
jgi:hypothetical protein